MTFIEKLNTAWLERSSLLCVGLDPRMDRIPEHLRKTKHPFFEFNRAIIEATAGDACAYKPQFACYAAADRLADLRMTMEFLRTEFPQHVTILDAKRGDIGSTADEYAREAFDIYDADAVTVNPYMGGDTLEPFTRHADRGVIVLCKTSNPGSGELQGLKIGGRPLYEHVAERAAGPWNAHRNIALVVGATWPEELARVRRIVGDMPLLVPGIGAQGGDLEATLDAGLTAARTGLLINSSRGIIFAGAGKDFASDAGVAARALNESINRLRGA